MATTLTARGAWAVLLGPFSFYIIMANRPIITNNTDSYKPPPDYSLPQVLLRTRNSWKSPGATTTSMARGGVNFGAARRRRRRREVAAGSNDIVQPSAPHSHRQLRLHPWRATKTRPWPPRHPQCRHRLQHLSKLTTLPKNRQPARATRLLPVSLPHHQSHHGSQDLPRQVRFEERSGFASFISLSSRKKNRLRSPA